MYVFMCSVVLLHGFGVILLQHGLMLSQKRSLLLLHNLSNPGFFDLPRSDFLQFQVSLLLENCELFLPKSLDFALMLLFPHSASLGIHLLKPFILGELLHQFSFEFILHSLLLGGPLSLQLHLEILCSL
jgi:hypothetical protein